MDKASALRTSKCETCGKSYVRKTVPEIKKSFFVAQCNCTFDAWQLYERRMLIRELLRYSKIPQIAWDDDLKDWRPTYTFNRFKKSDDLKNWIGLFIKDYKNQSCLIAGRRGTGKTRMSWYILQRLIRTQLIRGYYVTSSDLYNLFEKWETRQDIVDQCVAVELLLIDDLAESKIDVWNQKYLYNIINKRYVRRKPIIINTMRPLTVLRNEQYLGEHLISRLFEMAKSHVYEIQEQEDRRYVLSDEV